MTRRLLLLMPFAAFATIDCTADRVCETANTFAVAYSEWVGLRNTISPQSRDFAAREVKLWERQRRAYGRLEDARESQ